MTGSKSGGFREILDRFPSRTAKVLLNAAMAWDIPCHSCIQQQAAKPPDFLAAPWTVFA